VTSSNCFPRPAGEFLGRSRRSWDGGGPPPIAIAAGREKRALHQSQHSFTTSHAASRGFKLGRFGTGTANSPWSNPPGHILQAGGNVQDEAAVRVREVGHGLEKKAQVPILGRLRWPLLIH